MKRHLKHPKVKIKLNIVQTKARGCHLRTNKLLQTPPEPDIRTKEHPWHALRIYLSARGPTSVFDRLLARKVLTHGRMFTLDTHIENDDYWTVIHLPRGAVTFLNALWVAYHH